MTDTPAPLSADSLQQRIEQILEYNLGSDLSDEDRKDITRDMLALFDTERQRIADIIEKEVIGKDEYGGSMSLDDEYFIGRDNLRAEQRAAVRAVLIPPTDKLGDSKTSEEANSNA
jgi:hypothetical protein